MKKYLLLFVAMVTSLSAWTQTQTVVNVVKRTAHIVRTSTLYVGEVVLDGQQSFCYMYSDDITYSDWVLGAVKYSLPDFKDGAYSALVPSILGFDGEYGIAVCSNASYESFMNADWTSAENAGQACLSNVTVTSASSENLYETNPDFAAKCIGEFDDVDNFVDEAGETVAINGVLGKLSATNTDDVTYTVIDGQLVKLIKRTIDYTCELVTVIYTKAELASNSINISLADNSDNTSTLTTNNGVVATVTLADRTLWKDGNWNTLCLPFKLTIADSPLDGDNVDVRTLDSAEFDGETGTLTLNFTEEGDVTVVNAGTPFIIKWDNTGVNLTEDDLVFPGVTIYNELHAVVFDLDTENPGTKGITFKGTYAYRSFDDTDPSILFLETNNELCYPEAGGHIGAQRAYFQLNGLTAAQPQPGQTSINAFVLNFGGETGIVDTDFKSASQESGISNPRLQTWFTLDGRKLYDKSKAKGIYINNGKKVIIK